MTGEQRRNKILQLIKEAKKPLSGTKLGEKTGVSRQIIVQDIALIRAEGHNILSTARGYILDEPNKVKRIFKLKHTDEQIEEELNTIVDLGGYISDVTVNHKVYGNITAPLKIKNRRDIQLFLTNLKKGVSSPLKNITSGYHFHSIYADSEMILDEIEYSLREKGFLTEIFEYERN